MPAARRLTAPRTRTTAMMQNASVAGGRNTSTPASCVELSPTDIEQQVEHRVHRQILKLTMWYMMKLPISIQPPASAEARSWSGRSFQTLA